MKGLLSRIALVVFGVLAIAALLLAIFNDKGLLKVREQSAKLSAIQSENAKTETGNQALLGEIESLRSDPTTIEKLAREELKLVKPGEVVLVTPPGDSTTSAPPAPPPER